MDIKELQALYGKSAPVKALAKALENEKMRRMALEGLSASSASVVFAALKLKKVFLFILQDAEEAGYFYHDLTQLMGDSQVLFFPSSYKRAVKYGQKDAANEILRTEVLSRLTSHPSPITHHPTPNTQHPSPNTQHPSPITQHPSPLHRLLPRGYG